MADKTFYNAVLNVNKLTTSFQLPACTEAAEHDTNIMNSTQAIQHNKNMHQCILLTNSSSSFLCLGNDKEVHKQIAFKNFSMLKKGHILYVP